MATSTPLQFLVGTLDQGADCSPNSDDVAHAYVCKSGLYCRTTEEPVTAVETRACASVVAPSGGLGDACESDEDCKSGPCVSGACEAEASALFCASEPEPEPPSNWDTLSTNTVPLLLSVTANASTNAGTSNDITLAYRNRVATYSCTITATISDGGTQSCTPTKSSTNTSATDDLFYVKYASNSDCGDGLRVTELTVKHTGASYSVSYFDPALINDVSCEGCGLTGGSCNSCWIDCDGHDDCAEMKVYFEDVDDDGFGAACIG